VTSAPVQVIPLLEAIRPDIEQVERLLCEPLAGIKGPLNAMLCHALEGGKRLRPALVILAGRVFASPPAPFHRLAAAVEMLHVATLIHDDLIDDSSTRRGRETLHVSWPVGATVLAGDYLLGRATALVAGLAQPRVLERFGEMLCAICAGEIGQALTPGGQRCSRQGYYRSIEAKTASLYAAAAEMAGILAGAPEAQIAALRHFGHELGIAFQIVDDVLDTSGNDARLGKPAGSDLRRGLVTLPVICYLERGQVAAAVEAVLSGQQDPALVRAALEAIRSSGAIEDALAEARAHASRSQAALAALPGEPSSQVLRALADYVVERG
jgi:geranylgeranyl pyrophosphate synthase